MTPQEIEIAEPFASGTHLRRRLAGRARRDSPAGQYLGELGRWEGDEQPAGSIRPACPARSRYRPRLQGPKYHAAITADVFARRIELARVLGMQCWARDQFQEGNPQARLGLADAVMEEVLILDEERND